MSGPLLSLIWLNDPYDEWRAETDTGSLALPSDDVTLEDKVRFLARPSTYGADVTAVATEETHMSWVFLAGDRVYKLKKPVRYPFLDFSTLAARERDCREEMRLNRRLAPKVYLDVVPLTREASGALALGGRGEAVDWLVLMRRLPRERMLDHALAARGVERTDIAALADRLSAFYMQAGPADLTAGDYLDHLRGEQAVTRKVLTDPRFDLDRPRVAALLASIEDMLKEPAMLLRARVEGGHVVEGHGDLRPEHVCLGPDPVIIDCLEFNRAFRLIDPVDELAFLGLECERLGDGWIGELLLARYAELLGDLPPPELVGFYWRYRACLRARLSLVHILEHDRRKPEKWLPLARQYLALAVRPRPRQAR